MKTYSIKPADIKKQWVVVDAADQTVGRLATEVARVLRGKHKPTFVPHLDTGDFVVVINAEKVKFTGNKMKDKFYHHHTGWVGGIKSSGVEEGSTMRASYEFQAITLWQRLERNPEL